MASYKNQSSDLLFKSVDWFLYYNKLGVHTINLSASMSKNFAIFSIFWFHLIIEKLKHYYFTYFLYWQTCINCVHELLGLNYFPLLINFLKKKLLYNSLVLTLNNSLLVRLLQVWYLYIFSHSQKFFQKLLHSSISKKIFQIHFFVSFFFSF